jgi:hypothetical protein
MRDEEKLWSRQSFQYCGFTSVFIIPCFFNIEFLETLSNTILYKYQSIVKYHGITLELGNVLLLNKP